MAVILSSGVSIQEQIALLVELQEVDMTMLGLREQKAHLPQTHAVIEQLMQQAGSDHDKALKVQKEIQSSWKSLEIELEVQEKNIQKSQDRLGELKTNKEYQAHLFEIDLARKKQGQVEEQLLLVMDRAEAVEKQVLRAQDEIRRQEAALKSSLIKIEASEAEIDRELQVLLHSYQQLTPQLDEILLKQYEQVRSSRSDRPMVPVHEGTCSGCQLQVPPQLVAEVRRGEELHVCSHCQRFLFWPGEKQFGAK
tara:strand:+ start:1349 stop:2104 length:756 start_codon:yes stop_codon:yes gene_type:complete